MLVHGRPVPDVFSGEEYAGLGKLQGLDPFLGKIVAELYVLQTDVGDVEEVSRITAPVALREGFHLRGVAGQPGIPVLFCPVLAELPFGNHVVGAVVLTPNHSAVAYGVIILLAYTLEEDGSVEIVPVGAEIETPEIPGLVVAYDGAVAGVVQGLVAAGDVTVSVDIFDLRVAGVELLVVGERVDGVVLGCAGSPCGGLRCVNLLLCLP